jgi:vitamin B12 transporter
MLMNVPPLNLRRPSKKMRIIMPVNLLKNLLLTAVSVSAISTAFAKEDNSIENIIVIGSRTVTDPATLGVSSTVYDADFIKQNGQTTLADILRSIPSLAVGRTGSVGSLTQVRIRGAESNHTLILIDGVDASDPTSGEYNFAHLMSFDIERVEVLRGPQSSIYGSDAVGGVIRITTKKANDPFSIDVEAQGGSFGTYNLGSRVSGKTDTMFYALSASYYKTSGISIAPMGTEKDGYKNLNLNGRIGAEITPDFNLEASLRHVNATSEFDKTDDTFGSPTYNQLIDSDNQSHVKSTYARVQGKLSSLEEAIQTRFGLSYSTSHSENSEKTKISSETKGKRLKFDLQSSYIWESEGLSQALTGAVEYENTTFENLTPGASSAAQRQKQTDSQLSFVAEYHLDLEGGLSVNLSARYDDNKIFDNAFTYNVNAAWNIEGGTKIHASYGTGITDPTFYERYGYSPGNFISNPNLKPEKSTGYEFGVEQSFFEDKLVFDITYFHANLKNEIKTIYTRKVVNNVTVYFSSPENMSKADSKRQGIEFSTRANIAPNTYLTASYSYLNAKEPKSRINSELVQELRRPKHMGAVDVNHNFEDDMGYFNFGFTVNGEMKDKDFSSWPARTVKLKSYFLLHASVSYKIYENISVFARTENLFNKKYQEVLGYNTRGFGIYAGFRGTFK